jgi:hypothetical protein
MIIMGLSGMGEGVAEGGNGLNKAVNNMSPPRNSVSPLPRIASTALERIPIQVLFIYEQCSPWLAYPLFFPAVAFLDRPAEQGLPIV